MKPKITLLANNAFVKEQCVMCGECFDAGEILPELRDEDNEFIDYLCDTCAYKPQNYTSKLMEQAQCFENLAALLRRLAQIGVQPPGSDRKLELESLILTGDARQIDKLNSERTRVTR